jgi:tetratricopeptide (TPR) repeat protein
MSLRELAFEGCSAPYISAIEHGRRAPSLQVLQRLAEKLGVSVEWLATGTVDETASQLVDAELALRLGELKTAERLYEQLSASDHNPTVCARALAGLGEVRFREGETAAAIELFEEALRLAPDQLRELASAIDLLGRCYALRGDLESAIALFGSGRERALEQSDALLAVRFAVLLANAYVDVGDLGGSADALAAALRESAELADPVVRARVEWTQSRLHAVEGRPDLAAEFGRRALATLKAADDEQAVARAQQMLAYIELERGNAADARELLESARPTMERNGSVLERAIFDLELARALVAVGEVGEAKELAL